MNQSISSLVQTLAGLLQKSSLKISLAESCTGGLLAAHLTAEAGSSHWFDRGFVTYSNSAKTESIGVPPSLIEQYGAVSEEVAKAMVLGALKHSAAETSIAITGIAGPGGATETKPVGTVCFAWAIQKPRNPALLISNTHNFAGDRQAIREQACAFALNELIRQLKS
jgi:nicotinamide-nucleotide amidase